MTTPASPETFGSRLRIYKRREQLTVWAGAGIAGLIAITSAHVLDGRPQIFVRLVVTCAVAAGLFLAFVRVQFEWLATQIEREIEDLQATKGDLFPAGRLAEDSWAESLWGITLCTIALGWLLVLVGVWWALSPAPKSISPGIHQAANQSVSSLDHYSLPGFQKGQATLDLEGTDAHQKIQEVCAAWEQRRKLGDEGVVFVIGSSDRLPLGRDLQERFDSNVGLARARAESVASSLLACTNALAPHDRLPEDRLLILVSGPRDTPTSHIEGAAGFPDNRRVDIWIYWLVPRAPNSGAGQKVEGSIPTQ